MKKPKVLMMKEQPKKQITNQWLARLAYPLFFIISTFVIEACTFLLLGFDLTKFNFFIDFFLICFVAAVIFAVGNKIAQAIITVIFLVSHSLLLFINYTLGLLFGDIFSFDMFKLVGDAFMAFERSFINWWVVVLAIGLIIINIVAVFVLYNKVPSATQIIMPKIRKHHVLKRMLIFGLAAVITIGGFNLSLTGFSTATTMVDEETGIEMPVVQNNEQLLYDELNFKFEAMNRFGTYGFLWRSLVKTISEAFGTKAANLEQSKEYLRQGASSILSDMSFANTDTTRLDNNVIIIMCESLEKFAIYENLTPNLWALENGLGLSRSGGASGNVAIGNYSATNYFSKSKTNFSELGGITGSAPYYSNLASGWGGTNSPEAGTLDFTLPMQFKNLGYETNYLLNHDYNYYQRNNVYGTDTFGFENHYDGASIPNNGAFKWWGDWIPDTDVFAYYKDDIITENEKFFTWITTMSTHGPYVSNNSILQSTLEQCYDAMDYYKWQNPLKGTVNEEHCRRYVASVMILDEMIGMVIDDLYAKNILDTTTIMIYADHEAYYYGLSEKAKGIPSASFNNPNVYNIPMFVLDSSFATSSTDSANPDNFEISKFATFFDVYATIMDLFGLHYNVNLSFGESLFSSIVDPYRVYISPTSGILNAEMFTINGTDLISYKPGGANFTQAEITAYHKSINKAIFKANVNKAVFENGIYPLI